MNCCPFVKCSFCCPLLNQNIRLSEGLKRYWHTHPKDEKLIPFFGGQLLVVQCNRNGPYVIIPGLVVAYHYGTENGILRSYVLPISKTLRPIMEGLVQANGFIGPVNLW